MICFIAEEENFKTLFLNYNSNFFSELPFTQILKLCFTFSTNEKMTELSIKACVTFSIFLRPCLLSDDVLKMKTVGVFNKRSTNCYKKGNGIETVNSRTCFWNIRHIASI